jgi:predicted RNase H-like nuclease (RuvC/YqgF family)
MIQGLIIKKVIDVVLEKIMKKHNLNKLQKYVEEDNELDKQMKVVQKNLNKYGKYIEELEKEVAILKKDSHPSQEYICCRKCGCKIAKTKIGEIICYHF